jgi:hypothetical protein
MNATVAPSITAAQKPQALLLRGRYFYVGLGLILALIIFVGFTRTYWARMAGGTLDVHPAIHLHAALFFLWTLLFVAQGVLAARGRIDLHREVGLFGIALAGAMVVSGVLAMIVTVHEGLGTPREIIVRANAALSVGAMIMFTTFMALAIGNLKTPERHKRFIVLAMFSMLQAAVARLIMLVPTIAHPLRTLLGTIIVDLILLAVIVADTRVRGRLHPVYVGGAAFIVSIQYLRRAVLDTESWRYFVNWLAALGT